MKKKRKKGNQSFSVMVLMIFIIVMVLLMTYSYAYPVMTLEGKISASVAETIVELDDSRVPPSIETTTLAPGTRQTYTFYVKNYNQEGQISTKNTHYRIHLKNQETSSLNYAIYAVVDGIVQPIDLLTTKTLELLPHTTMTTREYQLVVWCEDSSNSIQNTTEKLEITLDFSE